LAYARSHFFLTLRVRDPFHTAAVPTEGFTLYDAYDLLQVDSRDALGNRITVGERKPDGTIDPAVAGNDYRVLEPTRVMDRNRNRSAVAYDALGLMVGTAVMGKPEESLGDLLTGFAGDLTDDVVLDQLADPLADPNAVLGSATSRLVYDVLAYQRTSTRPDPSPAVTHTIVRETHESDLTAPAQSPAQLAFAYSDGFGREIQRKIQAEPGPLVGGGVTVSARWVGTGWTIFNNKGLVVRQYEPFFSATHQYEFGVTVGVSPILFYDPLGRVVATLHPDHSYAKVLFGPWQQISWDLNDTVLDDPRSDADVAGYTAGYFAALAAAPTWQTWYAQRQGGALGAQEQDAATKAAAHAATPTTTCFDTLGRTFLTLADNGRDPAHLSTHLLFATRVELDIEDNQRAVRDAMQQAGDPQGRIIARYTFDLLGHRIQQRSMEAGERWMLNDVEGKPIRWWDSRGHTVRTEYDRLRRSLRSYVAGADPAHPGRELLTDLTVYGEQHPTAQPLNLRGEIYLHLDQAGSVVTVGHDFKGNQLGLARRMTSATQYRGAVDWSEVDGDHAALPTDATAALDLEALDAVLEPRLEADMYSGATTYDAMDRPTTLTAPHTPAMAPNVIRPAYNAASLVERVDVNLRGATSAGDAVWTPFVTSIVYDANGRRQQIDYGNGSSIVYEYDPLTFRLVHLLTRRDAAAFPGDCPPSPAGWPGCQIQSLYYTYDPKGHITHVHDAAQQTIFYRNKRVEPSASFTYDAVYRLIEATGREHLGQAGRPMAHSASDATRVGIAWSDNDGAAMGTYTEDYLYDAVGSFLEMSHRGDDPANAGWSRTYAYDETSLIEDGTGGTASKTSGRLSATAVGGSTQRYRYDAHGNTTRMPNLGGAFPAPNMRWDHRDQLCEVDLGGGGTAYYVYDASGERVRKVWEKSASLTEERLYLSGFEIFRTSQAGEQLVRETLHVMDGKQRIALIETRTADTAGSDGAPAQLIRYQFGNQLGSVSLELDDDAQVISYEEYTPYGSTSYQAVRSQIETGKRYRFTGKERDRESGFYYYGARFYAPWLGRWMSCDPVWKENLYWYVRGDPVAQIDPDGKDDEKPGFWESVRRSDTVQFLGGVLAGTSSSFIPGGFLIAPIGTGTGVLNKPSRAFQAGYGAGEAATGISQIVGGAGGEVIGAGLDATGIGALVGVPVNVASAAVIVQGGGNTVAGVGNFIDALRRDPEPPPSQPTKAAPAPEPAPAPKPVAEPPPKAPAPTEPPAPPKPVGGSPASKVGAKRGPKVGLDGPHNQTIKKRADQLKAEGNEIIGGGKQDPPLPEKIIETPGGVKSTRRPDILYKTPAGETRAVNVGKVKADGKTAVPREAAAKADLERAGYPTDFVPYNAPTSKPPTTPKPPPVKK
jgi:RHS repeat-associated protein